MKHTKAIKRIISNILLFILSISFLSYVYIKLFKLSVSTFCVISSILVLYAFGMTFSEKSVKKLEEYEQKLIHLGLNKKDNSKILLFALASLFPTYFCITLLSLIALIPSYTYVIWLITVFPLILINLFPAITILEEYYMLTRKKAPFVATFVFFTAFCCFFGIIVGTLI